VLGMGKLRGCVCTDLVRGRGFNRGHGAGTLAAKRSKALARRHRECVARIVATLGHRHLWMVPGPAVD